LASVVFYFSWQTPWTLFSLYQVKELHAGNFVLGLMTLMNTGGNLLGYKFWVRQIEKRGNLHVQWLSAGALILVPFTYALTGFLPRTAFVGADFSLYIIGVLSVLIGVALSGLNIAMFNSLLEATPEDNRTSYLAYFNATITITSIVAPLWGVTAYELWGWQVAFWICTVQRVVGVTTLILLWKAK
jgi:hypothetical protein